MSLLIDLLLAAAAIPLMAPALVLFLEVAAALFIPPAPAPADPARPRLAVLVPAHDEAAGIAATLENIQAQLEPSDRLLVVADNCTDDTAAIARCRGAEVVERQDALRRGKGYALDFGRSHLDADPPPVVVVVDADCRLGRGALTALGRRCLAAGRPVQAFYAMQAPSGAGWQTRLAEFAWIIRNLVRPLGSQGLGLPCQLMGTGMAFPWPLFAQVPLASGHLVEDALLGLDCAAAGAAPLFCPEAQVTSLFPTSAEARESQRQRWEHGQLGLIFGATARYFRAAARRRDAALLALVLDLCVPPVALLTLAALALFAVSLALGRGPGGMPGGLTSAPILLLALAVALAWAYFGRVALPLSQFALVPAYALGKIPLYLKFLTRRQVAWVRTKREAPPRREPSLD